MALLQEEDSAGLREEARAMSDEERQKAIQELKNKRDDLDFGVKGEGHSLKISLLGFNGVCTTTYCSISSCSSTCVKHPSNV